MRGQQKLNSGCLILILGILVGAFTAPEAHARRSDREGFNFGVGIRAVGQSDDQKGLDGSANSRSKSQSQAVHPRVGFAFAEHFNVGLSGYFETLDNEQSFVSQDGNQQIDRQSSTTIKGGSLFGRFMFAKFMHFEAGFGLYDRRTMVKDTYTNKNSDGGFEGTEDAKSTRGVGPGYHVGLGLEVPITNGFFFSSDFVLRAAQIRDYKEGGDIGKKRSRIEGREVVFGISHYID
jgi:hypothetical protein